jgi:hypothetical protein
LEFFHEHFRLWLWPKFCLTFAGIGDRLPKDYQRSCFNPPGENSRREFGRELDDNF